MALSFDLFQRIVIGISGLVEADKAKIELRPHLSLFFDFVSPWKSLDASEEEFEAVVDELLDMIKESLEAPDADLYSRPEEVQERIRLVRNNLISNKLQEEYDLYRYAMINVLESANCQAAIKLVNGREIVRGLVALKTLDSVTSRAEAFQFELDLPRLSKMMEKLEQLRKDIENAQKTR